MPFTPEIKRQFQKIAQERHWIVAIYLAYLIETELEKNRKNNHSKTSFTCANIFIFGNTIIFHHIENPSKFDMAVKK